MVFRHFRLNWAFALGAVHDSTKKARERKRDCNHDDSKPHGQVSDYAIIVRVVISRASNPEMAEEAVRHC